MKRQQQLMNASTSSDSEKGLLAPRRAASECWDGYFFFLSGDLGSCGGVCRGRRLAGYFDTGRSALMPGSFGKVPCEARRDRLML